MRVSTRIISGTAILMVLALLAFTQLMLIKRIQEVNDQLVSRPNARAVQSVVDDVELIEGISRKFFSTTSDYSVGLNAAHLQFTDHLAQLREELRNHRTCCSEIEKLESLWQWYRSEWDKLAGEWQDLVSARQADDLLVQTMMDDRAIDLISPLGSQAATLSNVLEDSFTEDATNARAIGTWVRNVSWIAAITALALGIVMIFLLRRINEPLRRLTSGTRMIAKGNFSHRLPIDGRDEFGELAADFNTMSERLAELDNMKKDFVSHVSHELKAPLASIRQTFHLLLEQIPGPLTDQQKRLLRLSHNSAERLSAMVGNLLDVSRMEAGSMEYSVAPVDLLALARSVAEEFEVQAQERNISIEVETVTEKSHIVDCDRDRMVQVIGNLFDNAMKFSPKGATILAGITTREAGRDRFLVFFVKDSGGGVPDEHKTRIFGKFHQVKQGKKMSGQGVGLGLAICRSIVEAHRGRIWVEDNPGGGSVFCFEIPVIVRMEATTA